jgi:hypothetical protein
LNSDVVLHVRCAAPSRLIQYPMADDGSVGVSGGDPFAREAAWRHGGEPMEETVFGEEVIRKAVLLTGTRRDTLG